MINCRTIVNTIEKHVSHQPIRTIYKRSRDSKYSLNKKENFIYVLVFYLFSKFGSF